MASEKDKDQNFRESFDGAFKIKPNPATHQKNIKGGVDGAGGLRPVAPAHSPEKKK